MKLFSKSNWVTSKQAKRGRQEAAELILECEHRIKQESLTRIDGIAQAIRKLPTDWDDSIERNVAFVLKANAARQNMRSARTHKPAAQPDDILRFQASTLFLIDCWQQLTPDQNEQMRLITGPITPDGVRVLSRILQVQYAEQSSVYVKADPQETHKQLVSLTERDGHELLAMVHSHIMKGASSTKPSCVDIEHQERFVKIGCDAIGGIFSLDGYVRFFSTCSEISVLVYGNGAELVEDLPREKVFKLPVVA